MVGGMRMGLWVRGPRCGRMRMPNGFSMRSGSVEAAYIEVARMMVAVQGRCWVRAVVMAVLVLMIRCVGQVTG
jgi:hypothetical protein